MRRPPPEGLRGRPDIRRRSLRSDSLRTRAVRLARAALPLLAVTCAAPGPMRDLVFTEATELLLVEDGGIRYAGERFPPERLPLRELEAWLAAQAATRARVDAVAAGVRRALVTQLAADLAREYGVRTRVLEREETERTSLEDALDPRGTFELHTADALLVVNVEFRELEAGSAGGAVLEGTESASLLGPGRRAVSDFHPLSEAAYVVCAVRRGAAWSPDPERDCAATFAARVLAAIRATRGAGPRGPASHR